jgi:hypothetical protein
MENTSFISISEASTERKLRTRINGVNRSTKKAKTSPVIDNLIAEGGENFFSYLKIVGLDDEPNMMILSSRHHYYYDYTELEGVTTLVNMRQLNLIKHLDSFLNSVSDVLSPKTNFIGCFSDSKTSNDGGITSRIYKRFINFLDSRTEHEIDKNDVSKLFESRGYKVIDMTEINGLTYFTTRNIGLSA